MPFELRFLDAEVGFESFGPSQMPVELRGLSEFELVWQRVIVATQAMMVEQLWTSEEKGSLVSQVADEKPTELTSAGWTDQQKFDIEAWSAIPRSGLEAQRSVAHQECRDRRVRELAVEGSLESLVRSRPPAEALGPGELEPQLHRSSQISSQLGSPLLRQELQSQLRLEVSGQVGSDWNEPEPRLEGSERYGSLDWVVPVPRRVVSGLADRARRVESVLVSVQADISAEVQGIAWQIEAQLGLALNRPANSHAQC